MQYPPPNSKEGDGSHSHGQEGEGPGMYMGVVMCLVSLLFCEPFTVPQGQGHRGTRAWAPSMTKPQVIILLVQFRVIT